MDKKEAYNLIWQALNKASKGGIFDLNESTAIMSAFKLIEPVEEKATFEKEDEESTKKVADIMKKS